MSLRNIDYSPQKEIPDQVGNDKKGRDGRVSQALQKPMRLSHSHASMAAAFALHGFAGRRLSPAEEVAEDPTTCFLTNKGGARSEAGMTCRILHLKVGAEARGTPPPSLL